MYKIIGADRREYGPVHGEQIQKWIAEGRANGQTRARTEDGTDWKLLTGFPEFAAALAAKLPPPALTPPLVDPFRPAEPAAVGFKIADCFSRAWALYQSKFWLLFGATAIILLITIGLESIQGAGWLAGALLGFALWGGLDVVFLKAIRGEPADVGDAFTGFKAMFVALMLASLVAHVLTAVGFFLLILPGIYLMVAWWMFAPLLIIDRKLDFWPAMELSRKTVNRNFWPCLGLFLLSCLLAFAGALACGIGLFFTLPLSLVAIVCAYEKLFGRQQEPAGIPGPAPLSPDPVPAVTSTPAAPEPAKAATLSPADPAGSDPKPAEVSIDPAPLESPPSRSEPDQGSNPVS